MKNHLLNSPYFAPLFGLVLLIHSLTAWGAELQISEFMAINSDGITDSDGETSDWIELANRGAEPVDLAGWSLTDDKDDPVKWRFPVYVISPGEHILVFASGKDRSDPAAELHANFKLSGEGEYLALVRPDGISVEHCYDPFPPQHSDISYGLFVSTDVLVPENTQAKVLVPGDASLEDAWFEPSFSPGAGWLEGTTPVGYHAGDPTPPADLVGYWPLACDVDDAAGSNDGVFRGGAVNCVPGPGGTADTALRFDGADDYVEVSQGSGLPVTSHAQFSIALWVKGLPQADNRVFSEGSGSNNTPVFNIGTDNSGQSGKVDLYIRDQSGQALLQHVHSSQTAFDGTWHHIAWVDDNGNATLFVDGKEDGTDFSYSRSSLQVNRTSIGAILRADSSYHFKGDIAEVSAWSRLLKPAEVAAMAAGSHPIDIGSHAYLAAINLDLFDAMYTVNSSFYLRCLFQVDDPLLYDSLFLGVQYDAGFTAYLNGTEIAHRNTAPPLTWNAEATAERETQAVFSWEEIAVSEHIGSLQAGENLLAIQGCTTASDASRCFLHPRLSASTSGEEQAGYFTEPSPWLFNASAGMQTVADTRFSVDRGFYTSPISVEISSETEGAEIRYTLDSSAPTKDSGIVYSGPIVIETTTVLRAAAFKDGMLPTNVDTHTYIFPDAVVAQSRPAGYPTQWAGLQADYEMDPVIVNNAAFADKINDALMSLPVLSVAMDFEDLFGSDGLYMNPTRQGPANERPASIELFYAHQKRGFQVNGGARISGNRSRTASPKHGFRFVFKGQYGPAQLHYRVFPDSPVDRFDTMIARPNAFDSWVSPNSGQRNSATYIRDQWVRTTQKETGTLSNHGFFVHLYLNGLYWGLFNLVERPDAAFAASYLGGEKEEFDAIKTHEEVVDGTITAYNALDAIRAAGLSSTTAYELIQEYLDLDNLCDYMIVNMFAPSEDWPGNYYMIRRRVDSAGFYLISWDSEYAFLGGLQNNRTLAHWRDKDSPTKFYHALRANKEFRLLFADHLQKHFFDDGVLTPEKVAERWETLADGIADALICESARWGDYRTSTPYRPDTTWEAENRELKEDYFPYRTNVVLQQFRSQAMYPSTDAPVLSARGGVVDAGFDLTMQAPEGTLYFTTDGTDPRLPGGDVLPEAVEGDTILTIDSSCHIKARALSGSLWSALVEEKFRISVPLDSIRITEIMYHPDQWGPPGSNDDLCEFIELKNTGESAVDMSGAALTGGIQYVFPEGSILDPGAFAVLTEQQSSFANKYPEQAVWGTYTGKLSNAGDVLQLETETGDVVVSVEYSDVSPWPMDADGLGYSLVPSELNPGLEQDKPGNWRASLVPGGSPGFDDADTEFSAPVVVEQPVTVTVAVGQPAVFSVLARSYPLPRFQWLKNGAPIPGAEHYRYTLAEAPLSDNGAVFSCIMENSEGSVQSEEAQLLISSGKAPFIRGDGNGDHSVDISDAIMILAILFTGGETTCEAALDANDDGSVNIADAVALLSYLFANGPDLPPPFPECGSDPTADQLSCSEHGACR